ncbi:hypothetical protein UR09_06645 [Candidatus Nitromaritima sp. SCGC AAA799-A02]|nr:hypothetical protein UR09_06645 [Candidatus Nitromaritima sp. SCGC AAA799-A02]KMP10360.1 hypothetical protein UZ36_07880 [Candidatus Nitromaritima sp. SCGC AAA799-C22]
MLVTGATGFLGRHLIPKLDFRRKIRCLVRKNSDTASLLSIPRVEIIYGDLTDLDSVKGAMKGVDTVIHMAAACKPELKDLMHATNVEGTQKIVEACRSQKIKKLIYLSSVAVVFEKDLQNDVYCSTKLKAEEIILKAGLPAIILRPSAIYPETGGFTVPIKIARYLPILPLPGFILNKKLQQPVSVKNVVEVILTALKTDKLKENKPYFIAGPNNQTISELIDKSTVFPFKPLKIKTPDFILKKLISLGFPIDRGHLVKNQKFYQFDLTEAIKDFGYAPLDIIETIRGTKASS